MRALRSNGLLIALALILLGGFVAVSVISFLVSSHWVRAALVENELPLLSNTIYSEIQASLLRPVYISSIMAHDTFLKDWMTAGERDERKVRRYLREIQRKYEVFSTFVVSALTRRYYHFDGVLKEVSPESAKDRWFFSMRDHHKAFRVDVDTNEAENHRLTIFINHKILDDSGRFIGVTGLGLDVATTSELIDKYQARFDREIYFVDSQGTVKSHSDEQLIDRRNIREQAGIAAVAAEVLAGERGSLTYARDGERFYLRYRYIPELDWFLMVEQAERQTLAPLRQALYTNLAIGGAITLLVLVVSGYTIAHYHARLEQMAMTDKLSGLHNRQSFEMLFHKAAGTARRRGHDLSILLFDVDRFKEINDFHGHLTGDSVIRQLAEVVREGRRESDLIARWGGDEFVILLIGCDEPNARRVAETLRQRVAEAVRVPTQATPLAVTISIGVATYGPNDSLDRLIARADGALYEAKRAGRNRVGSAAGAAPAST